MCGVQVFKELVAKIYIDSGKGVFAARETVEVQEGMLIA